MEEGKFPGGSLPRGTSKRLKEQPLGGKVPSLCQIPSVVAQFEMRAARPPVVRKALAFPVLSLWQRCALPARRSLARNEIWKGRCLSAGVWTFWSRRTRRRTWAFSRSNAASKPANAGDPNKARVKRSAEAERGVQRNPGIRSEKNRTRGAGDRNRALEEARCGVERPTPWASGFLLANPGLRSPTTLASPMGFIRPPTSWAGFVDQ